MKGPDVTPEELERCVKLLEAVVADRSLLARLPRETRAALLKAAGRVNLPVRSESVKLLKELRAQDRRRKLSADRQVRASSVIRRAREAEVFIPPALEHGKTNPGRTLSEPRDCYVCKKPFRQVHFFYDSMCPSCGDFNHAKRSQRADLSGRTALITGARVKIGFQAALMLLRAGARVVATTRFPHDAALRYSRERDFASWRGRLLIHGLDLRHSPSVEIFCRWLDSRLDRLDFLFNNAAQTVRRPPAFYAHLLASEAAGVSAEALPLLESHHALKAALSQPALAEDKLDPTELALRHPGGPGAGLWDSARLSQTKYGSTPADLAEGAFPAGKTDADLQQVDLRAKNSWRLTLSEVSTAEMLELQLINSVAPFILCARLKPLMLRTPGREKHIVNVSAMEGSFSRGTKTDKHPHTNMAKAALNMLTLTSAPDYAKDGIHMNAVDTGWVTDEDPARHAERKREEHDFQPPLDIVDGAARICDPVFSGFLSGRHAWGLFLKDYRPTAW